jgi:poly(hydroxyalkanoate) granule-associated protein
MAAEAKEAKKAVEEQVAEVKNAVEEQATDVKNAVEEQAVDVKKAVEEKAVDVKKAVEEKAVDVKKAAESAAAQVVDEGRKVETRPLVETVHRVLLAGVGAVALAKEDIESLIDKLVERGEIAEADGRKMIKDVMARRKRQASQQTKKAEEVLDKRVEEVLGRMNIPTKDEIEALSAKITALTKKVDELKKAA